MKPLFRISAGLILGLSFITSAATNDHKILGVAATPRNETSDLTLELPVCRVVKRIQLSAERGDVQLSGATVYFKASRGASYTLNVLAGIKEGSTSGWINIDSDDDSKRRVKKVVFSGHMVHSSDTASLKITGDNQPRYPEEG